MYSCYRSVQPSTLRLAFPVRSRRFQMGPTRHPFVSAAGDTICDCHPAAAFSVSFVNPRPFSRPDSFPL